MVENMKYFVFDNGVELIITSDKTLKDKEADICSCFGELTHFIEYARVAIDDGEKHEFVFVNGDEFSGEFSQCIEYADKVRRK
jgi:hypothetical protein